MWCGWTPWFMRFTRVNPATSVSGASKVNSCAMIVIQFCGGAAALESVAFFRRAASEQHEQWEECETAHVHSGIGGRESEGGKLVAEHVLHLHQQLIRIELPAATSGWIQRGHVVIVHDE